MSSQTCETVKIKSTHPESQGEYVSINVGDFDLEKGHELYDPAPAEKPAEPAPKKGKAK